MTTNLLSVIEQQHKALKAQQIEKECECKNCMQANAALAAGKQALEQTQGEASIAKYARHLEGCLWNTPLATGRGNWHCTCGLDSLVLDGELITHPKATEPHAQAPEIHQLMARAKMDSSLHEMSLATIQALQDVSTEYNAWIRFHSAGGDYDDFLKQYGAFNE